MGQATLDDFLKGEHDAILAAVAGRMRGDEDMAGVAKHRDLSEADLTSQVMGFWLQGIRSDLTLGCTVAMKQNMEWLKSFRAGHDLPFDGKAVSRCFAEISDEIDSRLEEPRLKAEYSAYRAKVERLIAGAFPEGGRDEA
jgi:hypothetical protein